MRRGRRPGLCLILLFLIGLGGEMCPAAQQHSRQRACVQTPSDFSVKDVVAEIRVGREVAAHVLGQLPLYDHPELQRYVSLVGQALVQHAGRSEIEYHFAVLDAADVNAYSAPGGYVFVTRGALEAMHDEAELAGVLGHELAHVGARHVVKELNIRAPESGLVNGAIQFLRAGNGSATVALRQAVDGAVGILFRKGYRREDELEADRGALVLAACAGYEPAALARFLERVKAVDTDRKVSSRAPYPATSERIREIRKHLTTDPPAERPHRLTERFERYVATR